MFIANESIENSRKSGNYGDVVDSNRLLRKKTEAPAQTKQQPVNCPTQAKSQPKKRKSRKIKNRKPQNKKNTKPQNKKPTKSQKIKFPSYSHKE